MRESAAIYVQDSGINLLMRIITTLVENYSITASCYHILEQ